MFRELCKSKIQPATVTETNLYYQGSITIDSDLLEAADIVEYEKVQVLNLNNGQRIETYAIEGEGGSGVICLNGAAARHAHQGDKVIIITYCMVEEGKVRGWKPKLVLVDDSNKPLKAIKSSKV